MTRIMQHLNTSCPDRLSFTGDATSWQQRYGVVLAVSITVIITALYSSAMATETNSGSQLEPDDARFYQLVSPCLDCHSIDDDSADYVGPTLKDVVGRRVASINNYGYSVALYQKAAVGLVWDEATLDRFLESPQTMAPGIAMTYAGISDPDDRARLIAWLATGPEPLAADALLAAAAQQAPEVEAILQIKADAEYGKYLAGNCLTCHFAPGASGSVPPITGLPANYFISALLEYQQGRRANRIMQVMSEPLGENELAALTAYFTQSAP